MLSKRFTKCDGNKRPCVSSRLVELIDDRGDKRSAAAVEERKYATNVTATTLQ